MDYMIKYVTSHACSNFTIINNILVIPYWSFAHANICSCLTSVSQTELQAFFV